MRAKYVIIALVLVVVGGAGIAILKFTKGNTSYTVKNPANEGALTTQRRYTQRNAPDEFYETPERRIDAGFVSPDPKMEREGLPSREKKTPEIVHETEPETPVDPKGDFLIPTPEILERMAKDAKETIAPVLPLVVQPSGKDGRPSDRIRSARWMPSHRIIPCRLVSTIETRNMQTPVIALTTGNVYHHGRLIIPANTEIHSAVGGSRDGDRVAANTSWRFVFGQGTNDPDNGKELPFSAIVLHSAVDDSTKEQELSAGFRGELHERDPDELKKLFGYTAIREGYNLAKDGLLNNQRNNGGGFQMNNVGQATDAPIDRWIDNQFQRMGDDSFFLRVSGGTAFFLYTMQPLDVGTATINNSTEPVQITTTGRTPATPPPPGTQR